jgi:NADH dehydrogenase FAD-containing subunit
MNIKNNKSNIILLGDGFFARGFLHNINFNKFHITQIYKDDFINPQDIMYALDRYNIFDNKYELHFRDYFTKSPNIKKREDIKILKINNNSIIINDNNYKYDHLVIGLGSLKSLTDWANELNNNINNNNNNNNNNINIIGMGPVGLELANILSKNSIINMYDILPKEKVFNYVSPINKKLLFDLLDKKNVSLSFGKIYENNNNNYNIFCIGNKPNKLTQSFKPINKYLQIDKNIYIGGDCANYDNEVNFIKTAQVAYQQGVYVAKRLNGDIPIDKPFEYSHNGISLHLGNKKVLIEGNRFLPDAIYPDFIIKLYSFFFI